MFPDTQLKASLFASLLKVVPGPSEIPASLPSFVSVCNRWLPRETDGADREATAEEKHSQPREGRMKRYSPTSRCERR